uniref:Uncharacterized protein n=1 Tax=Arundo donax TaxID=35708 RepID=A0A0A9DQL2_ARUDO
MHDVPSHVAFSLLIDFLLQSEQIFQSAAEGTSIFPSLYCSCQHQWQHFGYPIFLGSSASSFSGVP